MDPIALDFGAISIDNAALKAEGYRFYEGTLKELRQFKASPVIVVQTDIVHNEAIKHIGSEVGKTRTVIARALRAAKNQLRIADAKVQEAHALLSVNGQDEEIAKQRLKKFYDWVGAEIVKSSENIDLDLLMVMYFNADAPFEAGGDKKHEFPDAIALLSLEGWAEAKDINIIAVSQDKGWKNYAENSKRITVIPTLAEALEKFLPHNKVASIIARIREDSLLDTKNHVLDQIEQAIVDSVAYADVDVDACSSFYYEYEDVSATYVDYDLTTDDAGLVEIFIVRIEEDSIVLKLSAHVECDVEGNFTFSVHDSIDKDYVRIGSAVCSTKESYDTDILVTFAGDFSQGFEDIDVSEIEILETIRSADFGEVEPDWGGYDEEP